MRELRLRECHLASRAVLPQHGRVGSWRSPKLGECQENPRRGLPASCYWWGGLGAGRDLPKALYDPTGMQFYVLTSLDSVPINSTLSHTLHWIGAGGGGGLGYLEQQYLRRKSGKQLNNLSALLCPFPH